ncbi:MAG TPA: bifunctional DNA-formamidopyrimidine glycosylase/DNA-(apurinic or apyrimidinic site) lyase [Pseudomonadales bacterium]|nr:bifunctional DNA-formamidopyrimidine glycosylase/DNA-(apurinic or apyrimidinic site) lyase [Pseudomonadales bacterium]
MPELPEVETTRCGIAPHLVNAVITGVTIRNPHLRWPVPGDLANRLAERTILSVERRGKYLLIGMQHCTLLVHLGMSGSLRILDKPSPYLKHDHIDLALSNGKHLRYCDPRRFGSWLLADTNPHQHPLLASLGPEPLGKEFTARYLFQLSRKRTQAIKCFVMDSHVVVGVGNIYANEALFISGILPERAANTLTSGEARRLVNAIRHILSRAIKRGGTTLRDFVGGDGKPGYFAQELLVYGRGNQPCRQCGASLHESRLGQRSTVWCASCQS